MPSEELVLIAEPLIPVLIIGDTNVLLVNVCDLFTITAFWEPSINVKSYMINKKMERGKRVKKDFEYNSLNNKNTLDLKKIKEIIKKSY